MACGPLLGSVRDFKNDVTKVILAQDTSFDPFVNAPDS
jgi:hypothetical protein